MRRSLSLFVSMFIFCGIAWAQYGDSDIVPNPWGNVGLEEFEADTSNRNDINRRKPTICAGKRHTDDLSERILTFLSHYKYCNLYTRSDYGHFLDDVSVDQRYAVNYYAWAMEAPLLSGSEARRLEADFFGSRIADNPVAQNAPTGDDVARERVPDERGACGLPYPNDNVRRVQDVSAKNGMCDWYRENVGADGR